MVILTSIELWAMIKNEQLDTPEGLSIKGNFTREQSNCV